MELRRRVHKNRINNEIREIESFITRSEETIKRIKNTNMGVEYINNQINKLKIVITEKNKLLENKKIELNDLSAGLLDTVINEEYKKNSLIQKQAKIERKKQKKTNDDEKKQKKEISQRYWKGIISESLSERQKEKDYKYGLKYFNKICDQLPDYMKKSLSEMPNNKGYIWRGIYFYGDLPQQPGPHVMFEKQRGGVLVIHEYINNEYRKYEKHGKEKKQLIFIKNRNLKNINIDKLY